MGFPDFPTISVYLFAPSSAMYRCPLSMTDGAAFLLSQHLKDIPTGHVLHTVFQRLTSTGDDNWTSGQWMTERAGGSDVQNTETWATYAPLPQSSKSSDALAEGDYLINGFKFFSSATDANVAFLLAKTESGKLSTFIAPLRRTVVRLDGQPEEVSNGVRIHRLKNKLGTKELPTAELELKGMRAHLVGELDQGIRTIAPLLNVTRIQTLLGTLSTWRRAIDIAKNFAKCRTTVGEPLWLIPMHLRVIADLELKHRAAINLAFLAIAVMGLVENAPKAQARRPHLPNDPDEAKVIFRILTAICKGTVSKMSITGVQECQEAMGGVGYMDEPDEPEFNISRLLRSVAVYPIWEGTTNILASEMVRFVLKENNLEVLSRWFTRVSSLIHTPALRDVLKQSFASFVSLVKSTPKANLLSDARRVMFTFTWILAGALLALDAERDGDNALMEIARRWILQGEGGVGESVFRDIVKPYGSSESELDTEHVRWDCRIAWGVDLPVKQAFGHRSLSETSKL